MPKTDAIDSDIATKIDRFLVDNSDLETLKARLSEFNIFRVLRIEQAEIRHSNVLGWLMDPDESHGLGTLFLRRFLSRLLLGNETVDIKLSPADVELSGLRHVDVRREWKHIDICVLFEVPQKGRWCLLIENKIKGKESRGQLKKYLEVVKKEFSGVKIIRVFLTLEGDDSSESSQDARYIPWSHEEVLKLAEGIVEQNRRRIPEDARVFLKHYLDTLRRLTMADQELDALCREIYREHREAIDLIVKHSKTSGALDAIEAKLNDMDGCEFVEQHNRSVWFLPKPWEKLLPEKLEMRGWNHLSRTVPVCAWMRLISKGRLEAVVEVGPVANPATRIRFMRSLKKAGFKFGEKLALRKEAKHTRIFRKKEYLPTQDGEPDTSDKVVKELTETLWKHLRKECDKIMAVLQKFDWNSKAER